MGKGGSRKLRKLHNGSVVMFFTKYYYSDQVKEDVIIGSCSSHGEDENCIWNFDGKLKGRHHLEDVEVYGRKN
jgi:hypothetical protein